MIYGATSPLVSIITTESHSDAARAWFFAEAQDVCAIGDGGRTKVASALAKKHRNGFIDDDFRQVAKGAWKVLVSELAAVPVLPMHFSRACERVDTAPNELRSGDPLHLAIMPNEGLSLATFDRDLAAAARTLGVPVHPA